MDTKHPYSILITDDDRGSREALRDIVEAAGYRTLLAESGEEAIEIVQETPVHLVMTDMQMRSLSGLETIEMMRRVNALLPCILVTADANEGLIKLAFRARAFSVIPKPVSRNVVLYTVVRALIRVYGTLEKEPEPRSDPGTQPKRVEPGQSGSYSFYI